MIIRILVAIILVPVVLLTIYSAPAWCFFLLIEVFLVAALWEFFRILKSYSVHGFEFTALATIVSPLIAAQSISLFCLYMMIIPCLLMVRSMGSNRPQSQNLIQVAANLLCFFYLSLPFSLAFHLRLSQDGVSNHELLFILICVWVSDSSGYFVGFWLGKHKVVPYLSPKKSLEGFVASLTIPSLVAFLIQPHVFPGHAPILVTILGCVIGASGIAGDLFESFLKRGIGMKDSSTLIPSHGGVLDRIDSLLFALPFYYFLTRIVL